MEERILVPFYNDVFQEFARIYIEELKKLPHHINIIDELRANENAHSRIFYLLIQYPEEKRYPLWESFVKNVLEIDLNIKAPKFSCEKDRIDVLIKDDSDAIIIENKIHGANDQGNQLEGYIQKIKAEGYNNDQISVAYLTREGGKPGETSLSISTKCKLKAYKEINYRANILTWLENHALPSCKYKDQLLISAIQQYIDHLNGMFNQRKIQENMEKRFEEFLASELKIGLAGNNLDELKKNMEVLKEKAEIAELLISKMRAMYEDFRTIYYTKLWNDNMERDFPDPNNKIIFSKAEGDQFWGIELSHKGIKFKSLILFHKAKKIYYVCRNENNKWTNGDDVHLLVQKIFAGNNNVKIKGDNNPDYCDQESNYEKVYDLFKDYTRKLLSNIESTTI